MAEYRLSNQAKADLNEIADYTIETFGIEQARRYRDGLETCFQTLADKPMVGRSARVVKKLLRLLSSSPVPRKYARVAVQRSPLV